MFWNLIVSQVSKPGANWNSDARTNPHARLTGVTWMLVGIRIQASPLTCASLVGTYVLFFSAYPPSSSLGHRFQSCREADVTSELSGAIMETGRKRYLLR